MEPELCGPVYEQECTTAQRGHLDPELWGVLPVLEQVTSGFGFSFTERTDVFKYPDSTNLWVGVGSDQAGLKRRTAPLAEPLARGPLRRRFDLRSYQWAGPPPRSHLVRPYTKLKAMKWRQTGDWRGSGRKARVWWPGCDVRNQPVYRAGRTHPRS